MRGASPLVWLGDGEVNELAELRRESRARESLSAARGRPRRSALRAWLTALRARLVHAG